MERINIINEVKERMKNRPYRDWDKFTAIHGDLSN